MAGALLDISEGIRAAGVEHFFPSEVCNRRFKAVPNPRAAGSNPVQHYQTGRQSVKLYSAYGMPKPFSNASIGTGVGGRGYKGEWRQCGSDQSGLLDDDFIAQRAEARCVSEHQYMAEPFEEEVRADHVADAFVALALGERTTGHVMTVDGGNIEAALR